jgi:hypothetical protein
MRRMKPTRTLCILFALCLGPVISPAQTLTTLASFNMADGWKPFFGPLAQGPNGMLYGTTSGGGAGQNSWWHVV